MPTPTNAWYNWGTEEVTSAKLNLMQPKIGADADKPGSPTAGMMYEATDTKNLYVCFVAGTWSKCLPTDLLTGSYLIASADTVDNFSASGGPTKIKEILIGSGGTISVSFDFQGHSSPNPVYAQIYVSDNAVGTLRVKTNDNTYTTYTEDISGLNPGDLIQIKWSQVDSIGNNIKNFRLRANKPFTYLVTLA